MDSNKKTSFFKSRNFKYGSLSIALTVLLVVLIVALNAAIYAVTYSFGWYFDLTGTQYYGITETSETFLDSVLISDVKIQVIFCNEKDKILENEQSFYIYKCIESYKKKYPENIEIKFFDINKHPELAGEYTTQHGITLKSYNIIMESNKSTNVRVLDYDNFFTFDSDSQTVYAFNGEGRFTSYILSLCADTPKCYFIEGHGESITDGQGNKNALWEMLADVGFDNYTINLSGADANLDDAKLIVINSPIYDYKQTELEKIGKFMSDDVGNALVFLSPDSMLTTDTSKELVNFKGWLKQWGIQVDGLVMDNVNSLANTGGYAIMADYPVPESGDFAASLHQYMRELDSQPDTIIQNALAISCPWAGDVSGDESRSYDEILYSHDTAKVGNKQGQFAIASLVRNTTYDNDTEQTLNSYLFVSSAGYANEEYLNSSVFGNRDILHMLASQMHKKLVPVGIDIKPFASEELSISTAAAYVWTVILTGVVPIAAVVVGGIVCYRRKRS